jgi:phage tail-like protein
MSVDELLHTTLTASFRFVVFVDDRQLGAFTECTLPVIEWEMEQVKEGGYNTYIHQLPGHRKQATVTLKNGVGIVDELFSWCIDTMEEKFQRRNVTITVFNSFLKAVMTWHIKEVLPTRLTAPQLQSDSNTVAIQTLELVCGEVTLEGAE